MKQNTDLNRRQLLKQSALFGGAGLVAAALSTTQAQGDEQGDVQGEERGEKQGEARSLGLPAFGDAGYGNRSPWESSKRELQPGSSFSARTHTPLQDSFGMITPSGLHFERHHAGIPQIDPAKHELLVHGLVERPRVWSVSDLKRFPATSAIYFLECSGNNKAGWSKKPVAKTVQDSHGLTSCSEWTGVRLSLLLHELGVKKEASWAIAEGADACLLNRSIPLSKCLDDALIAYAQNGEALRPEQGYPLRLILPGWEGNCQIKWLHRLTLTDKPAMAQQETAHYSDLRPDGKAWQFSFVMGVNSVITFPSGTMVLSQPGFYEITGLAWSGSGKVRQVDISTDAGRTWQAAQLQEPVLSKAHTRFRYPWLWDGKPCVLQSRCLDEKGQRQPTRTGLLAEMGHHSSYHMNAIQSWAVDTKGQVSNVHI